MAGNEERISIAEFVRRQQREAEYERIVAQQEAERRHRLRSIIVLAALVLLMAMVILAFINKDFLNNQLAFVVVSIAAFVAASAKYLQQSDGSNSVGSKKELEKMQSYMEQRIKDLTSSLRDAVPSNSVVSKEDREIVLKRIAEKIESESASEYADSLKRFVEEKVKAKLPDERVDQTRQRLLLEVASLSKRANLNLLIGMSITLIGLTILGSAVFSLPLTGDVPLMVGSFVPKFTLAVVVEVFAYFFLALYKTGLSEIKYFQNEITNIEARSMAVSAAITHADKSAIEGILSKIADTDRNATPGGDLARVKVGRADIEAIAKLVSALKSGKE